jgi:hypothetical protein
MRPCLLAFALLLAASHSHATNLLDQLRAFNPYWADHADHLTGKPAKPISNDVDYVQAHLAEVLGVLSQAPTSQLSAGQLRSRQELTAVLADYASQGRFPINYYRQERIPVFIDEHDTYCAVGYLMGHTGEEAMARRIAAANNYAWVREIEEPGLAAWQQASGFSLAELKLIQGAYDYYMPDAFLLPNKYEVPQKPERVVRYFEGADKDKVWCYWRGDAQRTARPMDPELLKHAAVDRGLLRAWQTLRAVGRSTTKAPTSSAAPSTGGMTSSTASARVTTAMAG